MAATLMAQNGRTAPGVKEYVCDTRDDLQMISTSCDLGDSAFVIEDGSISL